MSHFSEADGNYSPPPALSLPQSVEPGFGWAEEGRRAMSSSCGLAVTKTLVSCATEGESRQEDEKVGVEETWRVCTRLCPRHSQKIPGKETLGWV